MKKLLGYGLLAAIAAGGLVPMTAQAAVVSTSGDAVEIAPPPDVRFGKLESDTTMFVFDERQGVTLVAPMPVDITVQGTYNENSDLTPGVIPAGTTVNSHFVHCDNVGSGGGFENLDGTINLDGEILGIQARGPALSAGDPVLGAPGTVYPTGDNRRQLSFNNGDIVIWFDGDSVRVHCTVGAHADQVRIITKVSEPPGGGGEGCTPGYWKQQHHFDSWTGFTPNQSFEATFGRDAYPGNPSLLDVLKMGGGGLNALGRHSVAALLNSSSPGVDYDFTTAQVIAKFQAAFDSGDPDVIEAQKDQFDAANNQGCGLN